MEKGPAEVSEAPERAPRETGKIPREWAPGVVPGTRARVPTAQEAACSLGTKRPLSQVGKKSGRRPEGENNGQEATKVAESLGR